MDVLTHAFSGAFWGSALALGLRGPRAGLVAALSWGALGGLAPDVDVVSRAPDFDALVARPLGLPPGQDIYYGMAWYSHHHAAHSLAFGGMLAAGLCLLLGLERLLRGPGEGGRRSQHVWLAPLALFAGFCAHLAGDLVTPASVWGGIQAFWPSPRMVGGWGWTWWFNNYDVLLLQIAGIGAVYTSSLLPARWPLAGRLAPLCALGLGIAFSAWQLQDRLGDYAYRGHTPRYQELEEDSLLEQRRILPADLYHAMRLLDGALPFGL